MDGGSFMALGLMVGAMIAVWFLYRKGRKSECEYDEMQLKIRSKGYQIGFFTALILMMGLVFLSDMNLLTAVTPGFAVYTALLICVTVFSIYCILHDAFLSVRGNAKNQIVIFGIIVLVEAFVTIRNMTEGGMLTDGKLTFRNGASAGMCICFLAILIILIVKIIRNRKEAEE